VPIVPISPVLLIMKGFALDLLKRSLEKGATKVDRKVQLLLREQKMSQG